jgi:hypothetical protein
MATITYGLDRGSRVVTEPAEPSACAGRPIPWRAIDHDVEQKVEARVNKKLRFRDHLFAWLVDYNRH